jgi:hypothetical protein
VIRIESRHGLVQTDHGEDTKESRARFVGTAFEAGRIVESMLEHADEQELVSMTIEPRWGSIGAR